jgi:RND family efflux transporter MFP subunit
MFKNWKTIFVVLIIVAIILGFVFARLSVRGVEAKTARVSKGNILSTISASGVVKTDSVELGSAKMAGRVEWVGADEGSHVTKGQVLVKMDGYDQAMREYNRLEELHKNGFISDLELEHGETAVENARIVAPFSGIVTEKTVIGGEAVSPGSPIITIVDIDNLWIEVQIDEVDIGQVKVNQRVRFTTDAYPDREFFGKINWINYKAELKKVGGRVRLDEEDLVFRGKVIFENGSKILKPGMSVYAEIVVGEQVGVIVVPREAITLSGGKNIVYVIKHSKAMRREVVLGVKDAEKVKILSGLSPGEIVAVSNLDKLKDGERVK